MRHYVIKFKDQTVRNTVASSWTLVDGYYEFMDGNGVIIMRVPAHKVVSVN